MVTGQLIDATATPFLFSGLGSLDFVLELTCPVLREGTPGPISVTGDAC